MSTKSMRCATKPASEAAARMRATGEQASQDSTAGDSSPAVANKQPAAPNAAGARADARAASPSAADTAGASPMDVDLEIEVVYSGELDSQSNSKLTMKSGSTEVGTEPTSDESEHSSPRSERSRSRSQDASAKHEDHNASLRGRRSRINSSNCDDRSASTRVGTTQEEKDRNMLYYAPELKPWMPSSHKLKEWYDLTLGAVESHCWILPRSMVLMPVRTNIALITSITSISSSNIGGTTAIETVTRIPWFRPGILSSTTSIMFAVMRGWTNSLQLARDLNRSHQPVLGLNYTNYIERHVYLASRRGRVVRVASTLCSRPREAFLPKQPYWRERLSSKMYEGIEKLQSLYKRARRSFDDGPPSIKGASRRTSRRDRAHPSSTGSEAPICSKKVNTPATGRGNTLLILHRHGGSKYAPQESVGNRVRPPKDEEEEKKSLQVVRLTIPTFTRWIAQSLNCARIWNTRGADATL